MPSDGKQHNEPVVPLSRCKACQQQRKKYGAYYNAGAHLRRAHFVPKPKGRGKTKPATTTEVESRGGKGGGDWPPMEELKCWMKEVEELVERSEVDNMDAQQQEAADASDEEMPDHVFENTIYSQPTPSISNGPYTPNDFFQQVSQLPSNYNYLSTTNIDHDLIGLQSTSFEMSQQGSYMDSSMFTSPVQNQFPNSAFTSAEQFQTEALYFPTNLPQNIDDQAFWSWSYLHFLIMFITT